jgi:hypothetical protein
MKQLAIITILFDYPDTYIPTFHNKIKKDFDLKDLFIIKFKSVEHNISHESYYYKFTYYRIKQLVKYIENNILNNYEYFILLDATDVGYVGNINNIDKIMKEYDCNILFGAERNLWPNTDYSYLYQEKKINSAYKYLNAGVFCAKPEFFISHSYEIMKRGIDGLCDQGNWQIEYLNCSDIKLDTDNKLVLNSYMAKNDIRIEDNKVKFLTNVPIFIHDNGGPEENTIKILDYFI